jgi:hypothetical protein
MWQVDDNAHPRGDAVIIIHDSFVAGPENAIRMEAIVRSTSGLTLNIVFSRPREGIDNGWIGSASRWVPHKGWQSVLGRVAFSSTPTEVTERLDGVKTNMEYIEEVFKVVTQIIDGA